MVAACAPHGWERTCTVFTGSPVAGTFRMHRSHGHDQHKKKQQHHHNFAQGVWHKASGKQSDFRRNWQGGSSNGGGGDGYGGSVGDVCINSQFCQGVWYRVTKSPTPSESSASYQRNPQPIDK
jgi:hypothetical protein